MAGSGRKVWTEETMAVTDLQNYLQDQVVMVFTTNAARSGAIAAPSEGMVTYLTATNSLEVYTGAAWESVTACPVFGSLAARDTYYSGRGGARGGDRCFCLGTVMTYDGLAWRFHLAVKMNVTSDTNGIAYVAHGTGQSPRAVTVGAAGCATDAQTVITKPLEFGLDVTNYVIRFARTDTSTYFSNPGLGFDLLATF